MSEVQNRTVRSKHIRGETTEWAELAFDLAGKAPAIHAHDDRYYTKSQVDSLVGGVDLSSRVPYTGAIQAVDLGTQNLSTAGVLTSSQSVLKNPSGLGPSPYFSAVNSFSSATAELRNNNDNGFASLNLNSLSATGIVTTPQISSASGALTLSPANGYVYLPTGKKLYATEGVGFNYHTGKVGAIQGFEIGGSLDNAVHLIRDNSGVVAFRNALNTADSPISASVLSLPSSANPTVSSGMAIYQAGSFDMWVRSQYGAGYWQIGGGAANIIGAATGTMTIGGTGGLYISSNPQGANTRQFLKVVDANNLSFRTLADAADVSISAANGIFSGNIDMSANLSDLVINNQLATTYNFPQIRTAGYETGISLFGNTVVGIVSNNVGIAAFGTSGAGGGMLMKSDKAITWSTAQINGAAGSAISQAGTNALQIGWNGSGPDASGTLNLANLTTVGGASGSRPIFMYPSSTFAGFFGIGLSGSVTANERASFLLNPSTGEVRIGAATGGSYFPTIYTNGIEMMRGDLSGNAVFSGNVSVPLNGTISATSGPTITMQASGLKINAVSGGAGGLSFNGSPVTGHSLTHSPGFILQNSSTPPGTGSDVLNIFSSTSTATSGSTNQVRVYSTFAPASGTGTFATVRYEPTINQTGGASGITRGLYVNPTLTAAADWRSIETSNNTGYAIYAGGTAPSYFGGNISANGTVAASSGSLISGSFTGTTVPQLAFGTSDNAARGYIGFRGGSWNQLGIWGSGQSVTSSPAIGVTGGSIWLAGNVNHMSSKFLFVNRTDLSTNPGFEVSGGGGSMPVARFTGYSGQTANYIEAATSGGTVEFGVAPGGNLTASGYLNWVPTSSADTSTSLGLRWFLSGTYENRLRLDPATGSLVWTNNGVERSRLSGSGLFSSSSICAINQLDFGAVANTAATVTNLLMYGTATSPAWTIKSYTAAGSQIDRLSVYGRQDPTRFVFVGHPTNQGSTNITEWSVNGSTVASVGPTGSIATTGNLTVTGSLQSGVISLSSDPSTLNLPSGAVADYKNTTTGAAKRWYNDSGTMKSLTYA